MVGTTRTPVGKKTERGSSSELRLCLKQFLAHCKSRHKR